MYQWCGFKSRRGKNKNLTALKSNSNTVWFNSQTYIYIYVYILYIIKVSHIEVNKNISFIQRGVLQITIVILDANSYAEIHDNSTYEEVPTDLMRKIENKVKKLANEKFKRGSITKDMKHYLVNSDVKFGKLQVNPKVYKSYSLISKCTKKRSARSSRKSSRKKIK